MIAILPSSAFTGHADSSWVYGLASEGVCAGDDLFLLQGCSRLVILRKAVQSRSYTLVGDAHVPSCTKYLASTHGVEAMSSKVLFQDFEIL